MEVTKSQCARTARKYGADLTVVHLVGVPNVMSASVDLPEGKIWADSSAHSMTQDGFEMGDGCANAIYAELIHRMSAGTSQCEDEDCEVCHAE